MALSLVATLDLIEFTAVIGAGTLALITLGWTIYATYTPKNYDPDLPEYVYRIREPHSPESSVPVVFDGTKWLRMQEFLKVRDEVGLAELAEADYIALIPPETRVRKIKVIGGAVEIRFEEGPHKNRLGLVSRKALHRTLAAARSDEIS